MSNFYNKVATFELAYNRKLGISLFGVWRSDPCPVTYSINVKAEPKLRHFEDHATALTCFEQLTGHAPRNPNVWETPQQQEDATMQRED